MATDLHEKIRTAIEHRLTLAQQATPGPWEYVGRNWIRTGPIDVTEADWGREGHDSYFVHTNEGAGAWRVEDVQHIAANDPAFTIRACRADLERLNEHAPGGSGALGFHCAYDWGDGDGWLTAWPCPEVLRLATTYAVEVTDE